MKRSYYDVLGIAPDSSAESIEWAYQLLLAHAAPRRGQAEVENEIKFAEHARGVLTDPGQRAAYDAQLAEQARRAIFVTGPDHYVPEALINRVWLTISAACLLLTGCEKWQLDKQVRELCAKDGGIKVYETVKLPAEKFDKWGMVSFYDPTKGENTLGPEYQFKEYRHYYRRGNPEMWSIHNQVVRRSDGKILGEAKIYIRRGGDLPGPWHDSSFSCPEPKDIGLIEKTFVRSNKE